MVQGNSAFNKPKKVVLWIFCVGFSTPMLASNYSMELSYCTGKTDIILMNNEIGDS